MTQEMMVYKLGTSLEEDRPEINYSSKANRSIDWLRLGEILRGERPVADYQEVQVVVSDSEPSSWGFYRVSGTLGLISAAAVEWIGRPVFCLFDLLPAKLNEASFFFLKPIERLSCLDKEKSELVMFPSNPSRIMQIKKYVFQKALIPDPLVFTIPESLARLFATPAVYDAVIESGIPGFCFTPLD